MSPRARFLAPLLLGLLAPAAPPLFSQELVRGRPGLDTLIAATAAPEAADETADAPERIIIDAPAPAPYVATEATTALKTNTSLLETPQTVNVIPRQILDDQAVITLREALRNVGGVNTSGTYRDYDIYSIRGFFGTGFTYLDGLRVDRQSEFQEEIFGLDRVEVIQGPASVLYGQNPPGGLVNLVSKTPQKRNFTDLTAGGGSFSLAETGLDTNAVLNRSGSVYGRVNLLWRQSGTFVDDVDPSQRLFFAPSLTIELTRNTRLTLLGQYYHDWRSIAFPLPAQGTVLPNINGDLSIRRNVGEPETYPNDADNQRVLLGYQFEHHFNGVLTLRQNARAGFHETDFQGLYPSFLDADQRTLNRFAYENHESYTSLGLDTSLVANFDTGSWAKHTALVGVDYYYNFNITKGAFGSAPSIDLFKPVYGGRPSGIVPFLNTVTDVSQVGLYFQDQVKFFDRLSLVAGGREDFVLTDVTQRIGNTRNDDSVRSFSPRVGVVYEVLPKQVSAYFSYSKSFQSNPGFLNAGGQTIDPEEGEQYEFGAKADLFNGRLSSTLAFYQIKRTNVPTTDPSNPFFYVVTGEQRHRGIDFNTTLSLAKGWDLIASYGFIDARVTEDNTLPVGVRPLDVPEHTFNVFTKYTLQETALKGLGVGVGFRYLTKQEGDAANTFTLPSYGVLDAAVYYQRGRFRAQVNVNNVTDERYASGSFNQLFVQPGDPINVRGSVTWGF